MNALIFNITFLSEYFLWSGWIPRLISWLQRSWPHPSHCLSVSMLGIGFLCSFRLESDHRLLAGLVALLFFSFRIVMFNFAIQREFRSCLVKKIVDDNGWMGF